MEKVDWRGPLVEMGFDVPKTEEDIVVDDNTQKGADHLFTQFVAWKTAGFTMEESFELAKSFVQGMGQGIAETSLDVIKEYLNTQSKLY